MLNCFMFHEYHNVQYSRPTSHNISFFNFLKRNEIIPEKKLLIFAIDKPIRVQSWLFLVEQPSSQ